MTAHTDPRQLAARLLGWPVSEFTVETLSGGLTNRTFKLARGGETLALRLDADCTPVFNLNRPLELSIHTRASSSGLAPAIVAADPGAGALITRFVDGKRWTAADLAGSANIERLSGLLRRIHGLAPAGQPFAAATIAAGYLSRLESGDDLYSDAVRCVRLLEREDTCESNCCCHNDVVAENIIGVDRPVLIDWEYACDNDPLFDVASLIAYHDLEERVSEALLGAYTGGARGEHRERLATQLRIYDALYFVWLAARQSVDPQGGQVERLRELSVRIPQA